MKMKKIKQKISGEKNVFLCYVTETRVYMKKNILQQPGSTFDVPFH